MCPRTTLPLRSCGSSVFTVLIGIAKPILMLPPLLAPRIPALIPTTSPRAFNNGPPELPGLIDASVWTMSCHRPSSI